MTSLRTLIAYFVLSRNGEESSKGGHRSKLASLRFCVNVATERRQHTQVEFVWITQRFRTIAAFQINWERLDASVFTSMLPATKRNSRTFATRETDVISERKHCSRKRRHTQVDFRTRRKCADKTQTIARKRWHGARKRKRSNVGSTCGRLYTFLRPDPDSDLHHLRGGRIHGVILLV